MDCHLLVPDLFWPFAAGKEASRGLALPALETIFACSDTTRTAGSGIERWLAAAYALPAGLPLAPFSLHGDGRDPGNDTWMRADPVHLKVHGDRLILADASRLSITEDEARDFAAALNAQLAPEGIEFVAARANRWYVRVADDPCIGTAPTSEVAGRNIDSLLPSGEQGPRWRRILNEAQMLLHAHPRNEAREAVRALPVNSLWFWGAGRISQPAPAYDAVWADHPLAGGLAAASTRLPRRLPASADEVLDTAGSRTTLVVTNLLPTTAYGDAAAWRAATEALDRKWLRPLLTALNAGRLQTLTVHGLGPDYGYTAALKARDRFRFWRSKRPLQAYAA
jgi:hypothetical protein